MPHAPSSLGPRTLQPRDPNQAASRDVTPARLSGSWGEESQDCFLIFSVSIPSFELWVGNIPWRRVWQPTPVFLPGESQGHRSLAGYSPWGRTESDITERPRTSTIQWMTILWVLFVCLFFLFLLLQTVLLWHGCTYDLSGFFPSWINTECGISFLVLHGGSWSLTLSVVVCIS